MLPAFDWGLLTVLLMLVGGDIIHRAFANTTKQNMISAVPFSFGWAAYAFKALTESKLYPIPDFPGVVINASNGDARVNHSWFVSRLLHLYPRAKHRDWDKKNYTMGISIVKIKEEATAYTLPYKCGRFWRLGGSTMLHQAFAVSYAVMYHDNWQPMLTLLACNLVSLAYSWGWKWSSRKHAARTVKSDRLRTTVLTPGKDSGYALAVISDDTVFHLDDEATVRHPVQYYLQYVLVLAWVCLLPAIREGGGCLFYAALQGYLYNCSRGLEAFEPENQGIEIKYIADIVPDKKKDSVMSVIKKLEEYEDKAICLDRSRPGPLDGAGIAMIPTFFPDGISDKDREWVAGRKRHCESVLRSHEARKSKRTQ